MRCRLQEPVEALVKPLGFYCEEAIDEQGEEILPGCTEPVHHGRANLQVTSHHPSIVRYLMTFADGSRGGRSKLH